MICNKIQEKLNSAFFSLLINHELEKITVKELIALANISKSTFYSGFENIDDFIGYQIDNLFHLIDGDIDLYRSEPDSSSCVFVAISETLYEHRIFLKSIYRSKFKKNLIKNIDYMFDERLKFCFSSNMCNTDKLVEKKIFLFSGYTGLIDKYIETNDEYFLKASAFILQETIECYSSSCHNLKKAL